MGPTALVIFDDIISKEPLGPAVRDGDDEWYDAVNWAVLSTILAEELGITSDEHRRADSRATIPPSCGFLGQPTAARTTTVVRPRASASSPTSRSR